MPVAGPCELACSVICIALVSGGYLTGKRYGGRVFASQYKIIMILYPILLLSFLAIFLSALDSYAVYGVLMALILVSPILAVALGVSGYKLRFHAMHGCCNTCGYDLRASKDICPECGEPMQKNPALATMSDAHDDPDQT